MIVFFSWVFILGVLGILIGLISLGVRLAKKRRMFSKKSGAFMFICVAFALIGAVGAMSLTDPVVEATHNESDSLKTNLNDELATQGNSNRTSVQTDMVSLFDERSKDASNVQGANSKKGDDAADSSLQKSLESYMFENFGGSGEKKYAASWYGSIKSFQIQRDNEGGYIITVDSTLYHDNEGKKFAEEIPPAFFGWANSSENPVPVLAVIVNSQTGKPLIYKENPISPIAAKNSDYSN